MALNTLLALLVGVVMGFVGSMPIAGPVAVLVLERGLLQRAREGLGVALGAAVSESLYAFLAFWGVGAVIRSSPRILPVSRLIGAAVLVALGFYLATRKSRPRPVEPPTGALGGGRKRKGFLLGLTITLLNPTVIATWTVAVAAVHSTALVNTGPFEAVVFAIGVGGGIVGWFTTMLHLLHRFQRRLEPATVDRLLHIIGWLIAALGTGLGIRPLGEALGLLGA